MSRVRMKETRLSIVQPGVTGADRRQLADPAQNTPSAALWGLGTSLA